MRHHPGSCRQTRNASSSAGVVRPRPRRRPFAPGRTARTAASTRWLLQVEQDAAALGGLARARASAPWARAATAPSASRTGTTSPSRPGGPPAHGGLLGVVAAVLEHGERHARVPRGVPARRPRRLGVDGQRLVDDHGSPASTTGAHLGGVRAARAWRAPRGRGPATREQRVEVGDDLGARERPPGPARALGAARRRPPPPAGPGLASSGAWMPCPADPYPARPTVDHARDPSACGGATCAARGSGAASRLRPPDRAADVVGERRHQQRAHDEGVQQHAERHDERDLREEQDRDDRQRGERRGQHDAGGGDDAAGDRQAARMPGRVPTGRPTPPAPGSSGRSSSRCRARPGTRSANSGDRRVGAREAEHVVEDQRRHAQGRRERQRRWPATSSSGATIERSSSIRMTQDHQQDHRDDHPQVALARQSWMSRLDGGAAADQPSGPTASSVGAQPRDGVLGVLAVRGRRQASPGSAPGRRRPRRRAPGRRRRRRSTAADGRRPRTLVTVATTWSASASATMIRPGCRSRPGSVGQHLLRRRPSRRR